MGGRLGWGGGGQRHVGVVDSDGWQCARQEDNDGML